jgi:hypothetical protein
MGTHHHLDLVRVMREFNGDLKEALIKVKKKKKKKKREGIEGEREGEGEGKPSFWSSSPSRSSSV